MNTVAVFREFHQGFPDRAVTFFDSLSDEQMRARPQPMVNSLAWLIWHMARVEDAGINRLVANRPQLLDEGNWCDQMEIPLRHHGTRMTSEEVTELSNRINIPALRAYHKAARARSLELVETIQPEQLEVVNDDDYLRQVLYDGGMRQNVSASSKCRENPMSECHTIKRGSTIPLLHNGEHREPLRVRIYLA